MALTLGVLDRAHAEAGVPLPFEVRPQALDRALVEFSLASGVEVLADGRLTAGKSSPGVSGRHLPDEALRQILTGTGLEARSTPSGTLTIEPAPKASPPPERLAQATPPPEPDPEVVVLPTLTVTGEPWDDTSYNVPNASTATKTDTPIMETPYSIQVVPQQVLQDQQVFRLEKALQNVSGVIRFPANQNSTDQFLLRGFDNQTYYRDGFRFDASSGGTRSRDTANLERIEVLKGPGSILYGRAEPGGIINLVTKQPLATAFYGLQQQFGSFDFYRTAADATGPLTKDDTLLYRFNLAYENAGSFRELVEGDRVFLAPALRWNPSDRTQV